MPLIRPDGSPLRATEQRTATWRSKLVRQFTFERMIAFFTGLVAGIGFLATPLKDPLLHWVYGTEIELKFLSETIVDPDVPNYRPEVLLSSSSIGGVPSGTIIWEVRSGAGDVDVAREKNFSTEFPKFTGTKTIKGPMLQLQQDEGHVEFSMEVRLGHSSKMALSDKLDIQIERRSSRKSVSQENFTGTWKVEFLDPINIGELEVKVSGDGAANGWLRVREPLLEVISDEVALSGFIDGSTFVLSADLPGVGRFGFKDVVVSHSDPRYSLPGEVGIYDSKMEPLAGYQPVPIRLNAGRLRSSTTSIDQ